MPGKIAQTQWPSCNLARAYPLALDATAVDLAGAVRLPEAALAALYLPVPADLAYLPGSIWLQALTVAPEALVLELRREAAGGGAGTLVASAVVPLAGLARLSAHPLVGRGPLDGCVGSVTVGDPEAIAGLPAGRFLFGPDGGRLAFDCIRPVVAALAGLEIRAAGRTVAVLRDVVALQGGRNLRASLAGPGTVRLDATAEAADLAAACGCVDEPPEPIRSINGVAGPDIQLVGDQCTTIRGAAPVVAIENPCGAPCCTDEDAAAMRAELRHLADRVDEVFAFGARLQRAVEHFERDVLAARLADDGYRAPEVLEEDEEAAP